MLTDVHATVVWCLWQNHELLGVGGLQEWSSALMACLPAAERARARLQMQLARMRARSRSIGWSQIALAASLAIMVHATPSPADLAMSNRNYDARFFHEAGKKQMYLCYKLVWLRKE